MPIFDAVPLLLAEPSVAPALDGLPALLASSTCAPLFLTPFHFGGAMSAANYPAGFVPPHYASLRLLLEKESWLEKGPDIRGYQARVVLKNKLGRAGRLSLCCGQAKALPYPAGHFTKAVTVNSIFYWDNAPLVIAELGRVPGGCGSVGRLLYRPGIPGRKTLQPPRSDPV